MSETFHTKRAFSMRAWLDDLLRVTRSPAGQNLHVDLQLYEAALAQFQDVTTKQSLLKAIQTYHFFPTVAELVKFFREERGERLSMEPPKS